MFKPVDIKRWVAGLMQDTTAVLAAEKPFTVHLNGQEIVTLLCSPDHLDELAVGFLAAEGLVERSGDLVEVSVDTDRGLGWVATRAKHPAARSVVFRRYLGSGCGGGTGFYSLADARDCQPVESNLRVTPAEVLGEMRELQRGSESYRITHGVHSAILYAQGKRLISREDIGRHNAIDKIAGYCVMRDIAVVDGFLVTSGRISSEIVTKAARMGVPVVVSRSVPTDLAVDYAVNLGITLVGFARGGRFNVYAHPERII